MTLLFFSCKTAEQIAQEKRRQVVFAQVAYLKTQSAQHQARIREQEDRLNQIFSQLEETQHEEKQQIFKREKERVQNLEELNVRMTTLEERLKKQETFIKRVTKQLTSLVSPPQKKSKQKSKKTKKSDYQRAVKLFEQAKPKRAKQLFLQVLSKKGLPSFQWAYANHYLALIFHGEKNYQQAMIHASKVYTRYPQSSKAPSSLIVIARCFLALKQTREAKDTLNQLIKQYPKAKEIHRAQALLKGL